MKKNATATERDRERQRGDVKYARPDSKNVHVRKIGEVLFLRKILKEKEKRSKERARTAVLRIRVLDANRYALVSRHVDAFAKRCGLGCGGWGIRGQCCWFASSSDCDSNGHSAARLRHL